MSEPQATAKAFRTFLLGLDDVIGAHGTAMLLRRAGIAQYIGNYPPSTEERNGYLLRYFSRVILEMFDIYGAMGARAIMQRVGRAQASRGLEESASLVIFARAAMKLMPIQQRVAMVLERSGRALQDQIDVVVRTSKNQDHFFVEMQHCPYCIDWKHTAPVCFAMIGFLHRVLQRATGGTETIEEIECCAQGAAVCKYRITLNPE